MLGPDPRRQDVGFAGEEMKEYLKLVGRESFPLTAEEAHMGFQPNTIQYDEVLPGGSYANDDIISKIDYECRDPVTGQVNLLCYGDRGRVLGPSAQRDRVLCQFPQYPAVDLVPGIHFMTVEGTHPLAQRGGLKQVVVKLPHARYEGGPEFIDGVPKKNCTFAWSELCGTRAPDCAMAPVPQVQSKSWYNTYIYIPEQRSHVERQYLERFVPGPDGEWLDVVKARRMTNFFEEQRQEHAAMEEEQMKVKSGEVVQQTDYMDSYSGEHLVACNNQLMSKQEVYERYNITKSDWGKAVDQIPAFEYDNLRCPWPFGRVDRNKKVSQHAYDWFDRRNSRIVSDRSYKLLELPSYYVDEDLYSKWRATGHNGVLGAAEDIYIRSQHLDDYPYKM
jgi:hypothetical protein